MGTWKNAELAGLQKLSVVCDDCGRQIVWGRDKIARAQIRYGVTTTRQLGTKMKCEVCAERGAAQSMSGKNVTVYANDAPLSGPTPEAARKLAEVDAVVSTCGDCGFQRRLTRDELVALAPLVTVGDLWRVALCGPCHDLGSDRVRITLDVEPPLVPRPSLNPAPAWSEKEVFGEDRADPFPTLPRSRLMRCVEEGAQP